MNWRILLKSIKFAFRARKRVLVFIVIYAILLLVVGRGLTDAVSSPGAELPWLLMAFVVSTLYAVLISQFRRRDIAILKCVSWGNSEILLLLIGEVVLVSIAAFFVVFQISVEILGFATYFAIQDTGFILSLQELIALPSSALFTSMFWIVVAQLPGLALAHVRAMKIPPMQALREE
ncbi:MAG: hypothetical protein ACW99U_07990 [Candidatus Thorarchaeota archaeon]|jgi:hypothetical protein